MDVNVINYLEDSAMVANVISLIALGFMGYLVRSIIRGVADLNADRAAFKESLSIYNRLNAIEEITYRTAKLYKDAVVGSNLELTVKAQILEDFGVIRDLHDNYVEGTSDLELVPNGTEDDTATDNSLLNNSTVKAALATVVTTGATVLAKETTDILANLADKVSDSVEV